MKALNLYGVNDLRYEDLPMPKAEQDEVLLKVKAVGICGSDIPRVFAKGTYNFPTIIGHEFSGEIEDADDKNYIGRKAAVFPLLPCGECSACKSGYYAQCKNYSYYGSRRDGAMAEYLAVKKKNLCFLPENVSFEEGAMTEPAAVALHCLKKSKIKIGDTVLIYGIGTISIILAQWAKAAGASYILLVGRSDSKVEKAEKMGFNATNVYKHNILEYIDLYTNGEGFDICIEGTGVNEGLKISLLAAKRFAQIVLLGNPMGNVNISQDVYWKILRKELQVTGTWNSSFSIQENDWKQALNAMQSGTLNLSPLITHKFKLQDYKKAFDIMRKKQEIYFKVMFTM